MLVPDHVFREYDVRGVVDRELTPSFAQGLGRAIGSALDPTGRRQVVVGRDHRPSGLSLSRGLIEGLTAAGCSVIDIGVTPTPVGYWAIHTTGASGGVHVTGSHNPPEYNGFKITLNGRSLYGTDILGLRQRMLDDDFISGQGSVQTLDAVQGYLDDLTQRLERPHRPMHVVVDAGNGTGGITAVPLYERLGYRVTPLYCELDGTFPNHHPDPAVESNLHDLVRAVKAEGADVGFAFDGDADRIGVVDGDGRVVWGDELMILLSRDVLKHVSGAPILGEVKCSTRMYDDIRRHGGDPVMVRTGHSIIKEKMKALNAPLAGEMSGHIFFGHRYYGFDDGVYAGARLLEILSRDAASIRDHLRDVPSSVSTPEIRRDCPEAIKFDVVAAVLRRFSAPGELPEGIESPSRVIDIDGVRAEWPDGWGLVRASNTGPMLVLRFEAHAQTRLEAIQAAMEAAVDDAIGRLSPPPSV